MAEFVLIAISAFSFAIGGGLPLQTVSGPDSF
jgi:hypothetical protein